MINHRQQESVLLVSWLSIAVADRNTDRASNRFHDFPREHRVYFDGLDLHLSTYP